MLARVLPIGSLIIAGLLWHHGLPSADAGSSSVIGAGNFTEQTARFNRAADRYLKGDARSRQDFRVWTSSEENGSQRYRTFRPTRLTKDAPTLFLLHGSGRDGTILLDKWRRLAARNGLFLIAPEGKTRRGWGGQDRVLLPRIIDEARKRAALEDGPLLVFGHSAGGSLATMLAVSTKYDATAIATHGGFAGENALRRKRGRQESAPAPVTMFLGDDDRVFSVEAARRSGNALAQSGHDVDLVIIEGHTHWYYSAADEINQKAWTFFRKHL